MANTNPGGVDFNTSPYFDDYDEDKKFVRVLFRPGRAVQARELTQMQTYQQAQVKRFAEYFFKQGSLVDGCGVDLDNNLNYVKLQTNYNGSEIDVDNFKNKIVFGTNSGVKGYCRDVTDLEGSDPKTLFVTYQSTGGYVLTVNNANEEYGFTIGNTITFSTGVKCRLEAIYVDPISSTNKMIVSNPTGTPTVTTATTVANTGSVINLDVFAVSDRRSNTIFDSNETIFTANTNSTRYYAQSAAERATFTIVDEGLATETRYDYGSKITVGEGTIYISDHFVKHSTQALILDKYTNVPTYKVGVVPNKSFIDYIEDPSLVDGSQGSPNFQAPGADRFKIDTVLTKYEFDDEGVDNEFVPLLEVENGVIRKKKTITVDGHIEDYFSLRLKENSGNFCVNDPIVTVREHLSQNSNGGRYDLESGGDNNLLVFEVDPFTAYISGRRNQIINRTPVEVEKGLATQYVEQTKTQVNYGNYIEVNEFSGPWDIAEGTKVELHNVPLLSCSNGSYTATSVDSANNKIGEARVRSFEYVSGTQGTSDAKYLLYLFEVTMNSGENFADVRSIYDAGTTITDPNRFADVILDPIGNAVLKETSFRSLVFRLPYDAVQTIRDDQGNVESGFRFKKKFIASQVSFTSGQATISSTDPNETFVGTDELSETQKNNFYTVIVNNNGTDVEATMSGTVSVTAGSNTVSGSNFTTTINVGDILKINTEEHRVQSIESDASLTLETDHVLGATSNNFTKVLPSGYIIPLSGVGGKGSTRIVDVQSPGAVKIDIQENISTPFSADVICTMDRANAREKRKILNFQTSTVLNPNTHPSGIGGPFGLGYGDIYQLHAIYESSSFDIPAVTSNTNVTSSYTLDNGQRDYAYEHGRIIPNSGVQPQGQLLVVFDHFVHDTTQGIGYCSVDSYPVNDTVTSNTTINTVDIPIFTSPTTGSVFNLRDCVDWRPIKTANTSTNPIDTGVYQIPTGGLHIPESSSDFDADLIYYRGRKSTIYLSDRGVFGVNDGVPAQGARQLSAPPPTKPDTLEVAEITIPPYPSRPKDVKIKLLKNRRFTMADLGKISDRVEKLEYFTALNYLEKQAAETNETDDDGFDRFKNGILVDPFVGFTVGNTSDPYWAAAIDKINRELTSKQNNEKTVDMYLDRQYTTVPAFPDDGEIFSTTLPYRFSGNKIFPPFTEIEPADLKQTKASRQLRLTEELSFIWTGIARAVPHVDNFFEVFNDPQSITIYDDSGIAEALENIVDAYNQEVAPLNVHWLGQRRAGNLIAGTQDVNVQGGDIVTTQLREITDVAFLQLASAEIGPLQTNSFDRVYRVESALWMRQRDFVIEARALKNGARVYAFFDGIDVTSQCDQIVLVNGATVEDLNDSFNNDGYLTDDEYDEITEEGKYVVIASGANNDPFYVGARTTLDAEENVDHGYKIVLVFRTGLRQFNVGQREFRITDSPTNSEGTTLTSARTMIYSQGILQYSGQISVNSRPIDVSFNDSDNIEILGRRVVGSQRVETSRVPIPPPPQNSNDPLSQSFYVDPETYPSGFYITSIDLFFRTKSVEDSRNCMLQVREMDNGFPTRKFLGIGDSPVVNNRDIQVSEDASLPTTFRFKNPVFVNPGNEYAFCVRPDNHDPDYAIWIAELGEIDITNPALEQRIEGAYNAGVLFSSSNDRTWTERNNQDMKFTMRIATFNTSASHEVKWTNFDVDTGFEYDALQPIIGDQILPGTSIDYQIKTSDGSFNVDEGWTSIKNYERTVFNSRRNISSISDETSNGIKSLQLRALMRTTNRFVAPYIDDENLKIAFSRNVINNSLQTSVPGTVTYTNGDTVVTGVGTDFSNTIFAGEYVNFGDEYRKVSSIDGPTQFTVDIPFTTSNTVSQLITIRNEENPTGPYASESRYITKQVTLNDGFEASDLAVYLRVNRPPGTGIRVYAKLMNENDIDNFSDKFWLPMALVGSETFTLKQNEYTEEKYVIPVASKTGGSQLLAGNVEISTSSLTVNGTETRFFEDLRIGDTIAVGVARAERTITSIANNVALTVDSVFNSNESGQDIYKVLNNIVAYTTPDGRNYEGYKYFAIKITFISSNPNYSSKVKDLRAIALA